MKKKNTKELFPVCVTPRGDSRRYKAELWRTLERTLSWGYTAPSCFLQEVQRCSRIQHINPPHHTLQWWFTLCPHHRWNQTIPLSAPWVFWSFWRILIYNAYALSVVTATAGNPNHKVYTGAQTYLWGNAKLHTDHREMSWENVKYKCHLICSPNINFNISQMHIEKKEHYFLVRNM